MRSALSNYLARVGQIAKELGCKVWLEDGIYPQMFVERIPPEVVAPPPVDQFSFLVLLHELGHVKHGHTQDAPTRTNPRAGFYFTNGVLRSEVEAWEFALESLGEELTNESRNGIRMYLLSYLNEAQRSRGHLWHLHRPYPKGITWTSPAFKFDRADYALEFLERLEVGR